ncbi:MAG: argininosuccinate lyase [Betaproteobacteria bacterium]
MSDDKMLWGARFRSPPDPALMRLSRAEPSYFRLAPYDILSSQAHARELQRAGILSDDETQTIDRELAAIARAFHDGKLLPSEKDEDVHTFIERVLVERLGALGGKLRAGRSRNDQAANDLKLYLRAEARTVATLVLELQDALIGQAEQHVDTLAPGFTHLQPAQPIAFAHQLLAHAQCLARDVERLVDWDRRHARSPLGAAALAGSAIATQPERSAAELGYDGPTENSIDAVGSRDHVAEFIFVAAMIGVQLSRLSEEIVLWASKQFAWIELDDAFATGSSIMPQKKNPDIAELTRGRSARLIGDLSTIMALIKAQPFSYNRDMSEDKRAAFDTVDSLVVVLPAMTGMVRTMQVNVARLRQQSTEGFTLATEVADWLSRRGVPFAEAHEITGALVRRCEDRGIGLSAVTNDDLVAVDARLTPDIRGCLTPEAAIAARFGYGGTAPAAIAQQIGRLTKRLAAQREWVDTYRGPGARSHAWNWP